MKDKVIISMHIARWRIWGGVIGALIGIPIAMWILSRGETLQFGIVLGLCTCYISSAIDDIVQFCYGRKSSGNTVKKCS